MRSMERIGGGCLVQGRWPGMLRHEGVGRKLRRPVGRWRDEIVLRYMLRKLFRRAPAGKTISL